jgi:hypothetical protein
MGGLKTRLTASLAAAWEAEMLSLLTMELLAERAPDGTTRTRLGALAACCQAHASRLLARIAAIGGGPLPVPPDEVQLPRDYGQAMRQEAERSRCAAERYSMMANLARKAMDPSAAWVCELNRAEELDRAFELSELANKWNSESVLSPPA